MEYSQKLVTEGYLKGTGGNVSIRIPGENALAITPSNQDYLAISADDVCIYSFDGKKIRGELKPSIEIGFHIAVYEARPDVNCVMHTHQDFASAIALINTPIPALFDEQVRFLGRCVEIIPYAPSGTSLLAKQVRKNLKNHHNAYILKNHGVLCLGSTPERAYHNVLLLEKAALSYLLALYTEEKIGKIPLPIREIAFAKLRTEQKKIEQQLTTQEGSPMIQTLQAEQYAISEWHNTDEVYRQLKQLVKQPMRPIRREKMEAYLRYFDEKCQRSKALIEEAKQYIPGGVQHNLAFNYPFPIAIRRAEGAYLWDEDDNRYIDFLQAGGPTLLGSNYAPVREKLIALIQECSPVTGLFHEYELKLAQKINQHMPGVEMFRMLGSGTEAVMAAIRAARVHTGKQKIIKVGGAYHGWSDQMVYGLHIPGTGRHEAAGIPADSSKHTQEFYPNNLKQLRRLLSRNRLRGGTAAVILEPVGPESGTRPIAFDFNRKVRELCDEFGALLIFDEVVTGFRLGLGGAQGYFGVQPDLTVFGKCITGGYPMAGGVGGKREIMQHFAAGISGTGERAYVGGTLSANPLSCAAGYFAIEAMEQTNAPVLAGKAGDRLTQGLKTIIQRLKLPFVAYNQGSIVHLETSAVMLLDFKNPIKLMREVKPRKHMMEEMGAAFMAHGIVTLAGSRLYTSMADTDEVIDDALERFETVLSSCV
ncbi:MAG: aminotransferase class III-fold pyridoxal phosphate-dependent enzyme [Anaerolineae bacterium]|nr:aminotransferase class III-fold pyridoxal phosphate-dependent enzyme [Anaerolineae bacterium]